MYVEEESSYIFDPKMLTCPFCMLEQDIKTLLNIVEAWY